MSKESSLTQDGDGKRPSKRRSDPPAEDTSQKPARRRTSKKQPPARDPARATTEFPRGARYRPKGLNLVMLQKIVRQSRTRLHDAADNLEDFQKIIDEILSDHISVGQASTHRGFSDRDAHKLLKYLAQRGATSFRMQAREDGSSVVSINRRPKFVLARQQSLLLRVLAEQRFGPQPDRYLTNKELKALLEADGEVPTDENLATNFSRLRDRLVEVGVNPYYVERKREKGARFIFASDAKLDIDPALKDAI